MTERERWIVYPLLFLALGAALRDKLFDQTQSKRIVCEELLVKNVQAENVQAANVLADLINAKNYAYQNVPFAPTSLQGPGMTSADWLRALRQRIEALQREAAATPDGADRETLESAAAPSDDDSDKTDESSDAAPTERPDAGPASSTD